MLFLLVALALVVHVAFWGAGLAVLAMPAGWRRFWPALLFPAGLALQSAVVWFAALSGIPGTNTYAWPALLLPAGLLLLAGRRRGFADLGRDLTRFGGAWTVVAASLILLVLPLAVGIRGLNTLSLGSCDAADYAAGARVLMEFPRGERGGFIGLTEVVQVHGADNFYDYWLRLNHFTPAALIALNGVVLNCAPHELTTLMTAILVAGAVPVVFWLARAVVRLPSGAALLVALLYGVSPVTWYAVAHVAPGQLLAAQAIALITWAGAAAWHARNRRGSFWHFAGVLALAYWLVLGSYNFIVIVCLVPAIAYAGGFALVRRDWPGLARWGVTMLGPLVACAVLFWGRAAGLVERFRLLRTYDFGWPIPPLTPEGWVGFLDRAPTLAAFGWPWRLLLSIAVAAAVILAVRRLRNARWAVIAVSVPALIGYAYLQARGALYGTNAAYDAYKLLAVFFPGILAASLVWLGRGGGSRRWRLAAIVLAAGIGLAHARSAWQYHLAIRSAPLRVTRDLRDLRKIEAMPDVASVNVLLPDMWSRLWANALLLRKPQFFATHTYEARLNTPLKGEWDLVGGIIGLQLPDGFSRPVNASYALIRRDNPYHVTIGFGNGWHGEEMAPASGLRWRWSLQKPELVVENPHRYALRATLEVDADPADERDITPVVGSQRLPPVRLGPKPGTFTLGPFELPPGRTVITLHSPQLLVQVRGDPRPLGWAARRIKLHVLPR